MQLGLAMLKVKTIILLYSVVGFEKLGGFNVSFSSQGSFLIEIILSEYKHRCPWYLKVR